MKTSYFAQSKPFVFLLKLNTFKIHLKMYTMCKQSFQDSTILQSAAEETDGSRHIAFTLITLISRGDNFI